MAFGCPNQIAKNSDLQQLPDDRNDYIHQLPSSLVSSDLAHVIYQGFPLQQAATKRAGLELNAGQLHLQANCPLLALKIAYHM